ncbi:hypothetical protein K439DRAFT_1642008 [Ramaria rubella]|nr:hypothetical protein K439DRAFT_1643124 [Ramaria rubella]KAF8574701.1 hypothetical protein K439DRAFT_1642008 [Ramaria rubella]
MHSIFSITLWASSIIPSTPVARPALRILHLFFPHSIPHAASTRVVNSFTAKFFYSLTHSLSSFS